MATTAIAQRSPVVLFQVPEELKSQESVRLPHDSSSQHSSLPWLTSGAGSSQIIISARRPPAYAAMDPALRSRPRFVAGDAFFHYNAFGSLRPDYQPVFLYSSAFLGLAVNAIASGIAFTVTRHGYEQMLNKYLQLNDPSYKTSLQFLLEWAGTFSVFIGFLSDCRPIKGRRRKPYMILGWLLACIGFLCIALVDMTAAHSWDVLNADSTDTSASEIKLHAAKYGGLLLFLTLLATVGLQVMHIPALSMTVEFAQRETLLERGKLQALYFVLFYAAAAVVQAVSTMVVVGDERNHLQSKLSLGETAIMLALVCILPIPFLIKFLDEPTIQTTTMRLSVRRRSRELWRFLQQNVAVRILLFISIHFFLIGLYNNNARTAVTTWCGITEATKPVVNAIDTSFYGMSLTFWAIFMVNWPWRPLAAIGSVVYISGYTFMTLSIVFDVARVDWFYALVLGAFDMLKAWIRLYAVVLSTEIADNGREGVTMGLVFVAQLLAGKTAHIVSRALGDWLPFHVTMDEVVADSSDTRWQVWYGAMFVFALNFLSLLLVPLLPQQKLDAQQLRAFGGYNKYASYGIVSVVTVTFCAIFVVNCVALSK